MLNTSDARGARYALEGIFCPDQTNFIIAYSYSFEVKPKTAVFEEVWLGLGLRLLPPKPDELWPLTIQSSCQGIHS